MDSWTTSRRSIVRCMGNSFSRREFLELSGALPAMAAAVPGSAAAAPGDQSAPAASPGAMVLGYRSRSIGRPRRPCDGGVEPASRLAGGHRDPEARRQCRRRRDRHGRHAQRHRAQHDGRGRRRVHDGPRSEDQEAGRTQRQRPRASRAQPRALLVPENHPDADDRHGTDHRAGRLRRLGHAARSIRHDEARDADGAAIEYAENGFPVMEKIRPTGSPRSRSSSRPPRRRRPTWSTAAPPSQGQSLSRRTSRGRSARWPKAGATPSMVEDMRTNE